MKLKIGDRVRTYKGTGKVVALNVQGFDVVVQHGCHDGWKLVNYGKTYTGCWGYAVVSLDGCKMKVNER